MGRRRRKELLLLMLFDGVGGDENVDGCFEMGMLFVGGTKGV